MAKRKIVNQMKNNPLFETIANNVKETSIVSNDIEQDIQKNYEQTEKILKSSHALQLSTDEKLAQLDAFEKENKRLILENSTLTDKIVLYLEEIDNLKNQLKIQNNLQITNNEILSKLTVLEEKNKILNKENEKLQLSVTNLTFEKTKYYTSLQKLEKQIQEHKNIVHNQKPLNNVKYNSQQLNGYSSWN